MKWYQVAKGTPGKLIIRKPNTAVRTIDWTTSKDLAFGDVLLDPVRLFNDRGRYDSSSLNVKMVEQGYALFGGESGFDPSAQYTLAVLYDDVKVS